MQTIATSTAEDMSELLLCYGVASGVALAPQPTGMYWFVSLFQKKGSVEHTGHPPTAQSLVS